MIQTTFAWNEFEGRWQVKERHHIDTMPALDPDTVAESATDFPVHEPIRVEITKLHAVLAAVETYRRCMACHPDHAPALTSTFAWGDTTALGDAITARQAGETWGVSPSRARHILANVEHIGFDQITGAKLYPSELAEAARRTQMVGQGRRTDLERKD